MDNKAASFWIGAALLGAGACAHTDTQAQKDNGATAPQPQAVANGAANPAPADQQAATANPPAAPNDSTIDHGTDNAASDMSASNNTPSDSTANDNAANAGSNAADGTAATAGAGKSPDVLQQRNEVISSSDGSQPGVIQDYSYGELTLTPSGGQQAQKSANVMSIGDNVPVFHGTAQVGTEALVPGTDVRVYYKNPSNGSEKQIIGIDILGAAPRNQNQAAPSDTTTTPDTGTNPDTDTNQ